MRGKDILYRNVKCSNSFSFSYSRTNSNRNIRIISQLIGIFLSFQVFWLKDVCPPTHYSCWRNWVFRLAIWLCCQLKILSTHLYMSLWWGSPFERLHCHTNINLYISKTHRNINIHHWMCAKSTITSTMGCVDICSQPPSLNQRWILLLNIISYASLYNNKNTGKVKNYSYFTMHLWIHVVSICS